MLKLLRGSLVALAFFTSVALVPAEEKSEAETKQAEREAAFSERMANTVLTGRFTLDDQPDDAAGKPERYEIQSVTKVAGSTWLIQTRIKYGSVDTVLPVPAPLEWAGDTPVVSMTDFTIPGMGTFTCRVLFYEDRYAGTWQHGEKGGHLWGTIKKAEPKQQVPGKTDRKSSRTKPEEK